MGSLKDLIVYQKAFAWLWKFLKFQNGFQKKKNLV
jgi:hypothetical protein